MSLVTRRGLHRVQRLLLEALPELDGRRVLCGIGSEATLPILLRLRYPGAPLTAFTTDACLAARAADTFERNAIEGVDLRCVAELEDLAEVGPFDVVILPCPARAERQLLREMLEQVPGLLAAKGALYTATDAPTDDGLRALLKQAFGAPGTRFARKRHKGYVWKTLRRDGKDRRRDHRRAVPLTRGGRRIEIQTRPGVFAYGKVDVGTRALLDSARFAPADRVLDLGCGAGLVGIIAALEAPEGEALLVDCSARAVALARANIAALGLTNARVELRAELEDLPGGFDQVLANPPYFSSLKPAELFIERGRELLAPGGALTLVAKAGDEHEALMRRAFPEVRRIDRRGYAVLRGASSAEAAALPEAPQTDV